MNEREPRRLLDDPATPGELDAMLRAHAESGPSDAAVDGMAAALGLGPALPPPSAPPPPPPVVAPTVLTVPWIGIGVALVVAAGATWVALGGDEPAAIVAQPSEVQQAGEADPERSEGGADPAVTAAEHRSTDPPPEEDPAPAIEPRAPRSARAAAPSRPRPEDTTARVHEETRLIDRAERSLATDPERALTLANEHRRRFPEGLLGVEREVVAIDALVRLGRRDDAQRRATALRAAGLGSLHARRVERLLGAGGGAP